MGAVTGRLRCPFCEAYEVDRLYLATMDLDVCACGSCGARWDEYRESGDYAGRGASFSVLSSRDG